MARSPFDFTKLNEKVANPIHAFKDTGKTNTPSLQHQKLIETEYLLEEVEKLMKKSGTHKKPNDSVIESKLSFV